MNVSEFIKEKTLLCISTLGLAIVGYMGYHAVRWIINRCKKAEKINQVAQEILQSTPAPTEPKRESISHTLMNRVNEQLEIDEGMGKTTEDPTKQQASKDNSPNKIRRPPKPPESIINRLSKSDIPQEKITTGQGEYIIFQNGSNGEKKEVAKETYEQVYKILNAYAPASIVNRNSDSAMDECQNRYDIIKSKVKEIDPSLEVVFVPRTLYELIYLRKCIEEDINHQKICSQLYPCTRFEVKTVEDFDGNLKNFESFETERINNLLKERDCWHLCSFEHVGDNDHPGVRDVAFRLNQVIVNTLFPNSNGFSFDEISTFAEKEIEFLKEHFEKGAPGVEDCGYNGPTNNFAFDHDRGVVQAMPINDDKHAQIIRDALALECSTIAQKAFLLYRGANFQKDSASCWSDNDKPYSVSYGSSLFAGALYDAHASAFYYMRTAGSAYAVPVPFDQMNSSPFFIPPTNVIAQLFGWGEVFHGRTKAWKVDGQGEIAGVAGVKHTPDHLKSELSKEELLAQFQEYKNKSIQLK
ncbi:MAG: hypothetical protein Tsb0021_01470 [Chlamydiales bacterium]